MKNETLEEIQDRMDNIAWLNNFVYIYNLQKIIHKT